MKYLKYFKTDVDYQNYFNSGDFVTPNVSYVEDTNIVHYNPYDLIIMTSESNPEVMKVCYNQGWAASPSEMYASEAAKVTSVGTAFQGLGKGGSGGYEYDSPSTSFTFSFDEFKYFTGVDSIVDGAFQESNIVSITIPDSVTSIGEYTFYGCKGLTSITIPNSVTSISEIAFDGCVSLPVENNLRYADTYLIGTVDRSLSTYTIKEGTKWIGANAFSQCSHLTSITIPNSVTSIGGSAFDYCSSLTSITIPNSVTSIGVLAFGRCYNLNKITCLATTAPSITSDTFTDVANPGELSYPSGSDYSSWMNGKKFYLGYYHWTAQEI